MSEGALTASQVIRECQELEARAATCYRSLAAHWGAPAALAEAWANDCDKTAQQITRTYQETVSDALETGFAFPGLLLGGLSSIWEEAGSAHNSLAESWQACLAAEERVAAFYAQAAAGARALLATIHSALNRASRTHRRRAEALTDLLEAAI